MKSTMLKKLSFLILFSVITVTTSLAATNESSCFLKIVAANDLAKTASVYIDGKLEGTLESGELTIFDLDVGNHLITLDGELIEKYELEVVFQSTYESKRIDLEANPGKRAVRITSEPSNAAIRIDKEWLEQTTPWQIILDVGKTYEIEFFKELYGGKTQSLYIPDKGEVIILDVEIPKADPPLKPRLTYPIDKSVCPDEIVVELVWESLDNPLQYELQFDGKVYTTSFNNARFYKLERGKTYSWRVTAVNKYGMRTTSEQYSFTVQENRGPEIAFVYPQNDSGDVFAEGLILKWEVTDADVDSITCDVYFGDEPDSLEPVKSHTTSNEYIVKELQRGKTYYWKIVATDSYGEVSESLVYSFTTMANRPPIEPFNIIPEDGMENLPDCLTLEWDCTDPDNDNLTYAIYLGVDADSMKQIGETTNKKFVLNDLTRGTTHYWKIVVFDSFGTKTEGPLNTFITKANKPPVIDPSSEVFLKETDRDVFAELKWFCEDPDDKLLLFDVYLGVDTEPSLILSDHYLTTLTKEKLKFATTYYWQTVAKDVHGGISKGPLWEFTTKNPPSYIPSDIVPKMILVEKGTFIMGEESSKTWDGSSPFQEVVLNYDFYIGRCEVTFSEYNVFCESTGREKPNSNGRKEGDLPLINVSWWDAIVYCNWLSEKETLPKAYDNNGNLLDKDGNTTTDPSKVFGYRLPTEAEWEYAARGGNKTNGYKYSGSDDIDEVAWYSENSEGEPHKVGTKQSNELGIYDMSGNVFEWCSDWEGKYYYSVQTNPYNSKPNSHRVFRGGSYLWKETVSLIWSRSGASPNLEFDELGFRVCRTAGYEESNRPFMLEIPGFTVAEGSKLTIDLNEYLLTSNKDILSFEIVQGVGIIDGNKLVIEPGYEDYGFYTIVVSVSDGCEVQDVVSFDLLVSDVNRPPKFLIPDQSILATRSLRLNLLEFSNDPDGDYLRYELIYGPGVLTGSIYSFIPEKLGSTTVTISAEDLKGGEATTTFTITVRDL